MTKRIRFFFNHMTWYAGTHSLASSPRFSPFVLR